MPASLLLDYRGSTISLIEQFIKIRYLDYNIEPLLFTPLSFVILLCYVKFSDR